MYDQFLAKTFHTPNFGDEQFDANSQNNDDGGSGATQVRRASTERARGMTPSSDSSDERVQTPSHRLTPVSTGLSAGTETAPRHAPGYPPGFFGQQLTQEQLYNARLSYNQHLSYQQYKQQLVHQMGGYNPLEMLQQGYGMGPPAAPPRLPPPPVQTVPEPVEEPEDTAAQNQMYTGMKRPSPDNCFLNVQKKPKPQKKKKKRDPNEPQKPVSAYALFFRDTQAAIKGQNPNASFGEVSKIVASMWDTLDVEHKNVYKRKTEDAKKDYLKALAAYRASLVSKSGREAETTTTTTYNSGFNNAGGCYNGYSQHGYSPPTSVAGGGTEQHHGANQRAGHHHQGYSPPPGGMQAKMEHGNTHAPPMHHHGYSQTPGGGVVSDNRANQLGHPFGQPASNQGPNMDHRLSHHHHGYSPTSGPTQQETAHSKGQQHNAYASSPGSASSQGGFNDNHAGSQDRNSQLGTHYHGYSPPRSISGENPHQMNAQYVTSGHPRLQTANTHQVYSNPGTSNISDNGQNNQQQSGGGYPGNMSDNHQNNMRTVTHHHPGYPQLTANSTQVDNRQTNSSQQTNQSHLGYSSSPGGGAQQETHQAGSQTTGYQPPNQSGEPHHQLGSQNVSNAYTQASSNDRQHHASPQSGGYNTSGGDGHHHQHAATQSGGYTSAPSPSAESHHQHAASQSVSSGYPPTSTNDQHHQHHQRMVMAHQSYSATQTSPYNGYSPRLPSSFDGFSSNSPSAQSSQGQSHMNQDCVQSQQQQSQVLVGRHMAPPGGQHMTVHQPPPI